MPPRLPASRGPRAARRGVTLLELLVVLVLLGLLAALTAPALLRSRPDDVPTGARVLAFARGAAVRRGETLTLDVDADGGWRLVVARGDSSPLARGTLAPSSGLPRRLVVTPLGLCLPDDDADAAAPWDAAACRPALDAATTR